MTNRTNPPSEGLEEAKPAPAQGALAGFFANTTRSMAMIFGLLLTAICLTVMGELLLKIAMNDVGEFSFTFEMLWKTFTEWRVIVAFALIFGGSLFWLAVISRVDFSFAYPLLAMSYVISLIPARFLLGEELTWNRIIGTIVIVLGVVIVTRQ
jgi:drug/metabolite transporter (DMT)-like permease